MISLARLHTLRREDLRRRLWTQLNDGEISQSRFDSLLLRMFVVELAGAKTEWPAPRIDLIHRPVCQAEDMGGYPTCDNPAVLQTKRKPRSYYCALHKTNRHVWQASELEPIPGLNVGLGCKPLE